MKKLLLASLSIGIMAFTPEEIVKKIDVKKIVETYFEAYGPTFAPFYPAEMHFRIYKTAEYLKGIVEKLYAEHKGVPITQLTEGEKTTISALLHSTHVAIGELLEKKIYEYEEEYKVKIIKSFMGEFRNDIITVKTRLGKNVIVFDNFNSLPWYPHDTFFLFLDKFWGFNEKYADSIGYESSFFEPVQMDFGIWGIKEMGGIKKVYTPREKSYDYKEVYNVVEYLVLLIEEVKKTAKKYRFPLNEKEYIQFMKEKGYKNAGNWEAIKESMRKWENFVKNNLWRRK